MEHWGSDAAAGARDADASTIALVDAIGRPSFGQALLVALDRRVGAAYLTAYRKAADGPVAMRFAGSLRTPDVTQRCWRIYRDGPHRRDRAFALAAVEAGRGPGAIGWCHVTADQIADATHRVDVYRRHGLTDRLSMLATSGDGGWLAVNLFRVSGQAHFADRDFARLEALAPLVMSLARGHERATAGASAADAIAVDGRAGTDRVTRIERRLLSRAPALSSRERAVCARLAVGMTYDGIAVDLGIAVTSAKTYRNRAFERLGIRLRGELAPLCFDAG